MRFLHRHRRDGHVFHVVEVSVVAETGMLPQTQNHVQNLAEPFAASVVVHLQVPVLVDHLPASHAEVQPPVAESVQHRRLLGDEHRVLEGQNADPGPNADALGAAGGVEAHGHRRRHDAVAGEVVFGQPYRIVAQLLGVLYLLHHFAQDAALVLGVGFGPRGQHEQAKLHGKATLQYKIMRPAPAQSPGRADAFCYILAFGVESGKASKRLLALTLFVPVTYNSRSHPEILSIL